MRSFIHIYLLYNIIMKPSAATEEERNELEKGLLWDKLRHTVDPVEISTLVEQLQQLDKERVSEV